MIFIIQYHVFCKTQWRHSVKTSLYKSAPAYFIVLPSSVKTKEVKVIEFHSVWQRKRDREVRCFLLIMWSAASPQPRHP